MKKLMVEETKVTKAVLAKVVDGEGSKSGKMKQLFDLGLDVKEISEVMAVRYNFVYNVVSNYCNMNGIQTVSDKKESKKDQIIALFLEGKTNKEISIETKSNYNYVFNTIKTYKAERPGEYDKAAK